MSLALISGAYEISDDEAGGESGGDERETTSWGNNTNGRITVEDILHQKTGDDTSTLPNEDCFSSEDGHGQNGNSSKVIVSQPPPLIEVTEKRRRGRPPGKRMRNHSKKAPALRHFTRRKASNIQRRQLRIPDNIDDNSNEDVTDFSTSTKLPQNGKGLLQSEAEFPCPHCPNAFVEAQALIKHLPVHDAQGIEQKTIRRRPKQVRVADDIATKGREAVEEAEPRYPCPFCLEAFGEAERLIIHLPKHEGESRNHKGLQKTINHASSKMSTRNKSTTKKIFTSDTDTPAVHSISSFDIEMKNFPTLKTLEIKLRRCDHTPGSTISSDLQSSSKGRPLVNNGSGRTRPAKITQVKLRTPVNAGDRNSSRKIAKFPLKNGKFGWKCTICEKIFDWRYNVALHTRVHAGVKPYQCPICLKRFLHRGNLKQHEWIHTSKEKPVKCRICPKQFVTGSGLRSHMLVHTGEKAYECSFCSKRFVHPSSLTTHVRLHTGDMPHACSLCPMKCAVRRDLKRHMEAHSASKQEKCPHCQIMFKGSRGVNRHIVTAHRK